MQNNNEVGFKVMLSRRGKFSAALPIASIIISFISLIISGLNYYSLVHSDVKMKFDSQGYTYSMFYDDIFEELDKNDENCLEFIDSGLLDICISFMNTSRNPIYLTDLQMYSIIDEEEAFVGYKVYEEKTKGNYSLQFDYYEYDYGGTKVDEYDDEIVLICVNPGEVCRVYFELRIYYTESMLKYIYSDLDEKWGKPFECNDATRGEIYKDFDKSLYAYLYDKDSEITNQSLYLKYCINGSEKVYQKEFKYSIIPAYAPEGF